MEVREGELTDRSRTAPIGQVNGLRGPGAKRIDVSALRGARQPSKAHNLMSLDRRALRQRNVLQERIAGTYCAPRLRDQVLVFADISMPEFLRGLE